MYDFYDYSRMFRRPWYEKPLVWVVIVIMVIAVIVIAVGHWYSTHRCVASHVETRYRTNCYKMGNGFQTCDTVPYEEDVCDKWEAK